MNRALALEPRNPQVLGYAAQVHLVVGQWDEAARLAAASALGRTTPPSQGDAEARESHRASDRHLQVHRGAGLKPDR